MFEMPRKLNCKYLKIDQDQCPQCIFTEKEPGKSPNSCRAFIEVPTIKKLLEPGEWTKQESYLKEIKEQVKKDQATLALGAGISIPAQLPGWCGLITQLFGYALQFSRYTEKPNIAFSHQKQQCRLENELIKGNLTMFEGGNVLEAGQYISLLLERSVRNNLGEELLKEPISAIIHNGLRASDLEGAKQCKCSQAKRLQAKKDSLRAVSYLLQTENGFRRALTYNYDTLVEDCLIDLFQVKPARIISHPGEWCSVTQEGISDPINIFHVHGCVLRKEYQNDHRYSNLKESKRIILSEDSYYNAERQEIYNWMNSIQSYFLNRDTCVFVGFSADDYNFRRILRQMGNDGLPQKVRPKHYLVLTIDDLIRDLWHNVCRNNLGAENINSEGIRAQVLLLFRKQLKMKAAYWKRYNFFPIWVTIQDIPDILLSLV